MNDTDQLQAKVDWLATELAKHQHTEADRDRWRVHAVAAQTLLDHIGLDLREVHQTDQDAHHDANCWRRHARCLADRISTKIEGDDQ